MSAVLESRAYPAAIDQKLRHICRRLLMLAVARAVLIGLAMLLAAMLAAMLIDWAFPLFSTTIRLLLTTSSIGLAIASCGLAGAGPIRSAFGLRHAAGDVDRAVPTLEERWTTVASFAESQHTPQSPIAKAMLRQVTSEAVAMERLVNPVNIATPKKINRAAMAFVAAIAAVVLFLASNWQLHSILLQRFWSPTEEITATQVESLFGDRHIPRGEPVALSFRTSGIPRKNATLVLMSEDDERIEVQLSAGETPSEFQYDVASLDSSFRYQVTAGDGRTEWHRITAIDRPTLAEVKLTLTPPEYVARPVFEKTYLPAHLQAVQGSRLEILMRPAAELKSFELQIAERDSQADESAADPLPQTLNLSPDKNGWYRYAVILENDLTLVPHLVSPHDLENEDAQKCVIRVLKDRAPTARVISPTGEMSVQPDEVIEIQFEAHDDHGIVKAELVVYEESAVEGEPPTIKSVESIPLGDQENSPHIVASAKLDLSKYEFGADSKISYAIRVTDNRHTSREQRRDKETKHPSEETPGDESIAASEPSDSPRINDGSSAGQQSESEAESGKATSLAESTPSEKGAGSEAKMKSAADANSVTERSTTKSTEEAVAAERKASSTESPGDKDTDEPGPPLAESNEVADKDQADSPTAELASTERSKRDATSTESTAASKKGENEKSKSDAVSPSDSKSLTKAMEKSEAKSDEPTDDDGSLAELAKSSETKKMRPEEPQVPAKSVAAMTAKPKDSKDSNPPQEADSSTPRQGTMTDDLSVQSTESTRFRLKIEEKLTSADDSSQDQKAIQFKIRETLEKIDAKLKVAQQSLTPLSESASLTGLADPQIAEMTGNDQRLAEVDGIIAKLRSDTKETPYAFVGLHMVEIGASYITPARDRLFNLISRPDVDTHSNVAEALHRVTRARELLAELLVRYERVLREERLASSIEQTAKIYEVYVENMHRFLRAQSQPNPNPLQRKMAVVEVDQDYLDRLREVTEMRRDLMAEFARMLGDDPRLLSKYMDLLKRRQTSLRDRLTKLHERQQTIATELSGWIRVDETQREDIWMLAAEARLRDLSPLAQEISQLEERVASQFPLSLDREGREAAAVVQHAKQLAITARTVIAKARRLQRDPTNDAIDLAEDVRALAFWLTELDAGLEELAFKEPNEEVTDFTNKRLADCRALFERIVGWTEMAAHVQNRNFSGLVKVDQEQLAFQTELLRIEIDAIDEQLANEFRDGVPESVSTLANQLKQLMENITFNQAAATFDLQSERLQAAEAQQQLALESFKKADELFEQIRRMVIEESDKLDPPDPNIADLRDPTLDELLQQLEREPNLNRLLGLPNRPQNLRVMSDFVASSGGSAAVPSALEQAAEQARKRASDEQKEARRMPRPDNKDDDKTEEEWKEVASAEEAQEKLQEKIDELMKRATDPNADPDEAAKLQQMAEQLKNLQRQLGNQRVDKQQWEEMVRSDQMRAILRAASRGEPLPDTQWNRLMSTLDDGLWQVKRRTPPEQFRQAIEQYQERIRTIMNVEDTNAGTN